MADNKKAEDYFKQGYNCAQSILMQFCEKYGMDKELAVSLACGMGGGMRVAEICGAASGAVMVLGLKYSPQGIPYAETKRMCAQHTSDFLSAFKSEHGGLTCRELKSCAITEGAKRMHIKSSEKCDHLVRRSAELLEEMGC